MLISSDVIKDSGVIFGTSGARGLVEQFTHDTCAAFTHAFISLLKIDFSFSEVAVAIDNRPSSPFMAQAVISAIKDCGFSPIYHGVTPTPALAYSAMKRGIPCIMITGSHIPFDRNGIKFYRPDGEITKSDEKNILLKKIEFLSSSNLPELIVDSRASEDYIERYTSIFDTNMLVGKKIGVYEHSSAGRDLYPILFRSLGAEVVSLERTNEFVPIDTEAVAESDKEKARRWSQEHGLDYIFSTDGDGDRPLVADENGEWLRGDMLGLLCSEAMNIEALAIPVSCNTIISESPKFKLVRKTKIGSPYVIAEFVLLADRFTSIAGFEANGGFLLGSDVRINGQTLEALPTRDAVLPALMLLSAAKKSTIIELVAKQPKRFTHSDRIQDFSTQKSLSILSEGVKDPEQLVSLLGFDGASIDAVNTIDGLRIVLKNNTIIHLRPSGNAPELRCYAEADTLEFAKEIVERVLTKIQEL